jgi:signal peptidase I
VTERPSGSEEPAGGFTVSEPRPAEREAHRSFLRELPILVIVALAVAIVLKTFVVQAFFIPSGSMEPTLEPGDRVLVQKVVYGPDRGDVIVFSDPLGRPGPDRGIVGGFVHWLSSTLGIERPEHEDFIKRVIGLPGETVELRDGRLFVDGVRINQPYLKGAVDTREYGPVRVPEGGLFVLGDNRLNSNDSRFGLGFVPVDKVVGRAFAIVWPPSRVGWIH